ncbi:MAG: hypothetical protein ACYTGH_11675, partial [Planctomycetota bacterium]
MLINPLLTREFLTSLRSVKAVAFGCTFIVALATLVMLMWPAEGAVSLASQSSRELFILLAMGQLILVLMVVPAFTAISITSEKERETYDLLYHTLLRPDQIVIGKLAAGVGFALILLLSALPMMGACLILGGVSSEDIVGVYSVLLSSVLLFGLVGMLCSCRFRSSYRSLIFCYVILLSLAGLTWVPSIIMGRWALSISAFHLLRGLSPFAAMISVVNPSFFAAEHLGGTQGLTALADSQYPYLMVAGIGSLIIFLRTLSLVASPPQPKKRKDTGIIETTRESIGRKVKFPFYLFDPRRRKRPIGAIINLMAIKEMRTKAFGRISWVFRAMWISVCISLLLAFLPLTQIGYVEISTITLVCLSLPLGMILLVSPVLTSSAISEEVEGGTFDALRMTRVTPMTIVLGKLQVAWFFVLLLVSSTFPTFFILAFIAAPPAAMNTMKDAATALAGGDVSAFATGILSVQGEVFAGTLQAFGVGVCSIFFATVIGIFASSFFRRSSTATSVAYGTIFALAL